MKYQLNIMDRLVLIQVLMEAPKRGGYAFHKALRKVTEAIDFSDDKEREEIGLNFDAENGRWSWKADAREKEVEIPDVVENLIRAELKDLDKKEALAPEHIPVYEKFVLPCAEAEGKQE